MAAARHETKPKTVQQNTLNNSGYILTVLIYRGRGVIGNTPHLGCGVAVRVRRLRPALYGQFHSNTSNIVMNLRRYADGGASGDMAELADALA